MSTDSIQARRVFHYEFSRYIGWQISEILLDSLARDRKRAFGVRIIGTPHQVVNVEAFAGEQTGTIIFKSEPNLTLAVETGRLIQSRLGPTMVVFPPMIDQPQHRCHPSDSSFRHHDMQLRQRLEHAAPEQMTQRAFLANQL